MSGILSLKNPLRRFDPFARGSSLPQDQPFSPFKTPELRINPLNPPETGKLPNQEDVDTSPVFKSSLSQFRNQQTPDRAAYQGLLREGMPTRQDNQLTKLGKALSLVSGAAEGYVKNDIGAGVKHGLGLMERPYQQALENYGNKAGMLKELSDLEYKDIADRKSLEVEIQKQEMDASKDTREWLKANSDIKLNDATAQDRLDQMKARGWESKKDEFTGKLVAVNTKTGETRDFGKFYRSFQDENNEWDRRFGKQQSANEHLERIRQAGAANLARLKDDLERANVTPDELNKAYDFAVKVVGDRNKGLYDSIFETKDGETVIRADVDPTNYKLYMQKVLQQTDGALQTKFFGAQPSPPVYESYTEPGKYNDYTEPAKAAVKATYPNNPELWDNPEAIEEAAKQLRKSEQTTPQVILPGTHIGPAPGGNLPIPELRRGAEAFVPGSLRRSWMTY